MNQLNLTYGPQLNHYQRRVWKIIRRRPGRQRAIPMPQLAEIIYGENTKSNTRRIQKIIEFLVEEAHKPIGSASSKPNGYWKLDTPQEYDDADNNLRNRIIALAKRRRALKKHRPPLAGQQTLECGG